MKMGTYKEVEGNLIEMAKQGLFDVICHGVNCFCIQGAGVAKQMAEIFNTNNFGIYELENPETRGDINKLGQIEHNTILYLESKKLDKHLTIINCYTQYRYGSNHPDGDKAPFDYEAFTLCMRKINHIFKGKHIGLPMIGSHLAGGDWNVIKEIIKKELKDLDITIVIYKN